MNALPADNSFTVRTAPETEWLVLRCAGLRTLDLVDGLNEAGIEAWAPRERIDLHARRNHPRQESVGPLMPGYVFARALHLIELLRLSRNPALSYRKWDSEQQRMVIHGLPHFGFFKPFGEPERIREIQLAHLRQLDGLARPKGPLRKWEPGERIRLTDGAYAGLRGAVIRYNGEQTTIEIDGWVWTPTISTRQLHPELDESQGVKVNADPTEQAPLAKAVR